MLYVFTGPSLNHDEAKLLIGSEGVIWPPIKGGDILSLLCNDQLTSPSHIHIIDGYYYNVPSVRHKEIIQAIQQGIIVSGCSSMGAIRAAELEDSGMIGTGRIFDYFKTNFVSGDDEIAVAHHPEPKYDKISTPLINIRFTIDDLCKCNLLSRTIGNEILEFFQQLPFSERHLKSLEKHDYYSKFYGLLSENFQDWKKTDAIESFSKLKLMSVPDKVKSKGKFHSGYNHVNFYNDTSITSRNEVIDRCNLPSYLSKNTNYPQVLYDSFNRSLTVKFAKYLGFSNSDEELSAFSLFLDDLKSNEIKFISFPSGYKNYSDELIDQELLILKLHLWFVDSSGLTGNLGSLSDYYSCNIKPTSTDLAIPNSSSRKVFYQSFLTLLSSLSDMPNELAAKYFGISGDKFCGILSPNS